MPNSSHPQAKFDPIPPDLDLKALVEKTSNFDYVIRVPVEQIANAAELEHLVLMHVIIGGRPLVLDGWDDKLPPWLFSPTWLLENVGGKEENVRDISNGSNIPMTTGHYLKSLEKLTKQWSSSNFRDPKRQRLYLKDIDCPEAWHQHLQGFIPESLFYLNDCVGEKGGPGSSHERNLYNQLILGKGIAPAGDLMSNLPEEMRAENMMCYIGHEGTYTPAHREMCASLGQNIMVETSTSENGEQPGSSIWFMTESKDREVVSEYFLSMLGHDIEVENHFAQVNAWKRAPFPVYIVEQKVGDFILIPPLAPHQVWNRGTRTMKVAWNRTTVETLELALHEALPRARMVCRDEQYKNKAIIYYSLLRYCDQLKLVEQAEEAGFQGNPYLLLRHTPRIRQLHKDFKRLFALYTEILISEMFSPGLPEEKTVEFIPFDSNITCSYCRCNIFNRFLTCKTCVEELSNGEQDTYDICMECYAMGRSCGCISNLKWVEQWQWPVLSQRYEQWRAMVISNDGYVNVNSSPQSLEVAKTCYGKKPVAQICQEQLKLRPWQDLNANSNVLSPVPRTMNSISSEPEAEDDKGVKKKRSRRKYKQPRNITNCHICCHGEWNWKLAFCTHCSSAYCYGSLWRAFDLKPQTIMEQADWMCPKCLGICGCGKCRRDRDANKIHTEPYRPKGTLLGHDTRKVADPRSVESLVDFRRTNLTWLKNEGDDDPKSSMRMQKLVQKAQEEKSKNEVLEEEIMANSDETRQDRPDEPQTGHMTIDPLLWESETPFYSTGMSDGGFMSGRSSDAAFVHDARESHTHSTNYMSIDHGIHVAYNSSAQYNESLATMIASGSSYPDPSGPGCDKTMGIGYFQQANDVHRISSEDHDSSATHTPSNSDYRILKIPYKPMQCDSTNKKRQAHGTWSDDCDNSKKKKLAQAKGDSTFIMTKNRLEDGASVIVKLTLSNSKDILQEISKGADRVRRNLRPPCPTVNKKATELNHQGVNEDHDEDDGICMPERGFQTARKPSVKFKSHSEGDTTMAIRRPRRLLKPQPMFGASEEPMTGRGDTVHPPPKYHVMSASSAKRGSVSNVMSNDPNLSKTQHVEKHLRSQLARSPGKSQPFDRFSRSDSPRVEQRPRGRLSLNKGQHLEQPASSIPMQSHPPYMSEHPKGEQLLNQSKNIEQFSHSSPEKAPAPIAMKSSAHLTPSTLTRGEDPIELSRSTSQNVPTLAIKFPQESRKTFHSTIFENQISHTGTDTTTTLVVDSFGNLRKSPRRVTLEVSASEFTDSAETEDDDVCPAGQNNGPSVDRHYLNAKMEALRELESEMEAKSSKKAGLSTKHVLTSKSIRITGPLGSIIPGSLQRKQTLTVKSSLPERHTLGGKSANNVDNKPSLAQNPNITSASASLPNSINSEQFSTSPCSMSSHLYSGGCTSSDEDDESIPAKIRGIFNDSSLTGTNQVGWQ